MLDEAWRTGAICRNRNAALYREVTESAGVPTVVSVIRYHDDMVRTQISLDDELYLRAKEVARRKDISFAELCRRSLEEVVAREPSEKPWMAFAGMFEGHVDDSASIDLVVYDRDVP